MLFNVLGPRAVHTISIESPLRSLITSSLGDMVTSNDVGSPGSTIGVAEKKTSFNYLKF